MKLAEINSLHMSLKFTIEMEQNGELPFLDMKLCRKDGKLSSNWYYKPTDTGLIMNFHALAPIKYKRSVVTGFVYRIFRACSSWSLFHESLEKAKQILHNNQYPLSFYEPLIKFTLEKLIRTSHSEPENGESSDTDDSKCLVFLQYRGRITDDYVGALRRMKAPCQPVLTLRKVKTVLPSLKPSVDKALRSRIVYKINCSRCNACYVGQTDRHLHKRFKEHLRISQPVGLHLKLCGVTAHFDNEEEVSILQCTSRNVAFLETLEALWQRDLKPRINTRDEFRKRELTIRL